jgi:hypothetical protein
VAEIMSQNNINWLENRVFRSPAPQRAALGATPLAPVSPPPGGAVGSSFTGTAIPVSATAPSSSGGSPMTTAPLMGVSPSTTPPSVQGPPPVTERGYIPGYLESLMGRTIRAEFLLGGSVMTDRVGILREVGVNYFVLEDQVSHALIMCDLYSVKFVTTT